MEIIRGINAVISFLLEIAMLVSISYFGFYGDKHLILKILVGAVLPIVIVIFWSLFMSPRAAYRFDPVVVRIVALILFVAAAFALYKTDLFMWGVVLATVAVINAILTFIWKQ